MSYILNRNTDGTRTTPLQERELMQELTPADPNYGKVVVGTDGTFDGEIALAKDSDVVELNTRVTAIEDNTTLAEYGITDAYTKTEVDTIADTISDSVVDKTTNQTIAGVKTFSSSPIVPTPTTGTQAVNKNYADTKVAKVVSTDKAIARYNGTTGELQDSSVIIGDNGNLLVGTTTDNGSKLQVSNGNSSLSVSPHPNGVNIKSTGDLAPHYITDFTVYKGVPGSGISKLRIAPITDNLLVGTATDNGVDMLQVNGSIIASNFSTPILISNQPVSGNSFSFTLPQGYTYEVDILLGGYYYSGLNSGSNSGATSARFIMNPRWGHPYTSYNVVVTEITRQNYYADDIGFTITTGTYGLVTVNWTQAYHDFRISVVARRVVALPIF